MCRTVQVEVEDYHNYEKALAALTEAFSILDKSPAAEDTYRARITELSARMTLIKAYLHATKYVAKHIIIIIIIIIICYIDILSVRHIGREFLCDFSF